MHGRQQHLLLQLGCYSSLTVARCVCGLVTHSSPDVLSRQPSHPLLLLLHRITAQACVCRGTDFVP